ncbi:hypothetical protein Q5P01_005653 [Channa striata]|uniref:Uncharacterized protein n=1 Tax=Channa striata TaxID=64152 RepID=A0AA88NCZ9_CHASR|nr:hypothetical protein Q5P01_005653 [Channa striata]
MDSQSRIRYLKIGIGFFEKEIEFDRKKAKIFKEIYLTADRKFEEYLKGLSHGQDTGECSEDFPSKNHFPLAEMKKLLTKRNELLAEIANLVAEGEKESIAYLQINNKFLEMLIKCEKHKTAEFKKRYFETAEECKEVIYELNEQMRQVNVEIVFEYEPQPPQRETLLAQRGKQSSCSGTAGEKKKSNATESQKTIDQLQSKLTILEMYLEYEKLDTAKYKQLFLKVVYKYEQMLNRIKQRQSSCRCDPNIKPVQHRYECNIAFTCDDEELLTDMDMYRTEMKTCMVLIEEEAEREIAAVTEEDRGECSRNYRDAENNHLLANTEYQMIVMGKQMLWMRSKLAKTTMVPSARTPVAVTEVRQEGGERKEAVLQTSSAPENQPLLTQTENLRMDENTPGDTVNVTEGSVKSQKV